jgi:hypothetical protein
MRCFVIAVVGVACVTGCAQEAADPRLLGPLPGETFADPEDPAVGACLTAVSLNTGTAGVFATGMVSSPESTTVSVSGNRLRWQCNVDDRGRVTSIIPLSDR